MGVAIVDIPQSHVLNIYKVPKNLNQV